MSRNLILQVLRRCAPWTVAIISVLSVTSAATASHSRSSAGHSAKVASGTSALTFNGTFGNSLAPWTTGGGGAQCSNYGTPSRSPRLRGTFAFDTSNVGAGFASGKFTLPADPNFSTYPLEACDLDTASMPVGIGTDMYYGLMVYVPSGWTIPNKAFTGVNILELHFQNVWGSPVTLQLHPDHVTVALETGGCTPYTSALAGCQYRSNADNTGCRSNSTHTCLPGYYAMPPGAFVQGSWNEVLLHIHWASDSTGAIQAWYKQKGQTTWTQSLNIAGLPTVQWNSSRGCCYTNYRDETEAYTAGLTAPLSIWLDNDVAGTSLASVESTMP